MIVKKKKKQIHMCKNMNRVFQLDLNKFTEIDVMVTNYKKAQIILINRKKKIRVWWYDQNLISHMSNFISL